MKRSCSRDEAGENASIKKQATQEMTTLEKVKLPEDPISDVEEEDANERYTNLVLF